MNLKMTVNNKKRKPVKSIDTDDRLFFYPGYI